VLYYRVRPIPSGGMRYETFDGAAVLEVVHIA
jgi:hypothetical protein